MTIKKGEVEGIVREHRVYVESERKGWDNHRRAYRDKFWDSRSTSAQYAGGKSAILDQGKVRTQVNLVRFWVDGFVSGLFYKGLHPVVRSDDVVLGESEELFNKYEPGVPQRALESLLFRFLNEQNADILSDNAFTSALVYPEIGLKLGVDDRLGDEPVDKVWLDVLPPWECVWDRKCRNPRDLRYVGHLQWIPREDFEARFGHRDDLDPVRRPDVVRDGFSKQTDFGNESDGDSVCILEFYDYTETFTDAGTGDQADGVQRFYLVTADSEGKDVLEELQTEAMPYTTAHGRPLAPILPVVLINVPEYPMMGIAAAGSVYEINKERNFVSTYLANAMRRDVQRVLMLQKNAWDEDSKAALLTGEDNIVVEVESDTLEGIAKWLEQQQVSPTVLQYLSLLNENQSETSGVADFTRGKALNYATATEVMALNDYTESTLGRLRKRMDKLMSALCKLYLRVLYEAVDGDTIPVRVNGDVVDFDVDLLNLRWEIELTDLANTPLSESQRRADFQAAAPMLLDLLAKVEDPEVGETTTQASRELLDYLVKIYNLPDELSWRQLSQVAGPTEDDLAGEPTPEEAAMLAQAEALGASPEMLAGGDPAAMQAASVPALTPPPAPSDVVPPQEPVPMTAAPTEAFTPEEVRALLQDPSFASALQAVLGGAA